MKAKGKAKLIDDLPAEHESDGATTSSDEEEDDQDVSRRYLAIGPDILNKYVARLLLVMYD